jgi:drug/metabolite transporter (DMT)-like permease
VTGLWLEWATRLIIILALLIIIAGLVVLALPDTMEGDVIIRLDDTHSLHAADMIGAILVGLGALLTWVTVWAWQHKRIQG